TGSTGGPSIVRQPFRITPNPAQSTITISAGSAPAFTYAIHTLTGQVIARGTSQSGVAIHLDQEVSNGVYFVQLHNDDEYFATQKLIINR
ncbi:MAG: T9SS type A sorting domain-containing protein, partial [Bacteroidia bacterium]